MSKGAILSLFIALAFLACESVPFDGSGAVAEGTVPMDGEYAAVETAEGVPPERTDAGTADPGFPPSSAPANAAEDTTDIALPSGFSVPVPETPLPGSYPSPRSSPAVDGERLSTVLPVVDPPPERVVVDGAIPAPAAARRTRPPVSALPEVSAPPVSESVEERETADTSFTVPPIPDSSMPDMLTTDTSTTDTSTFDSADRDRLAPVPAAPLSPGPGAVAEESSDGVVPRMDRGRGNRRVDGGTPPPVTRENANVEEKTTSRQTVGVGDVIRVTLPGPSWLFLRSSGNAEFLSRETAPDLSSTNFLFRVSGPTHLSFESQDLSTGTRTAHEEIVAVDGAGPRSAQAEKEDERGAGENRAAAGGGSEGSESVSDDLAAAGDVMATPIGELTSFNSNTHARLIETLREEDGTAQEPTRQDMEAYLDLLMEEERWDAAEALLETLWSVPRWQSEDILFRLARFHDLSGPSRDVEYALELYQTLIRRYPFSAYLERAEERERYLKRHFFYIR